MTKQYKKESSNLALKIFSSALLIQQGAAAAPAFAHGHHGQGHEGRGRDAALANLGPHGGGLKNSNDHFGVSRQFDRPLTQQLPQVGELTRVKHLPRMADSSLPLNRQLRLSNIGLSTIPSIDLDLSSSAGSITIDSGMIRHGSSVTIVEGNSTKTIHEGDTVTAAEFVSFQQAQSKGGQSLVVDQSGRASGGSFSLGSLTSDLGMHVDDLVIPQNVQSIDRISSKSQIDLSGHLLNYGTINETTRGRSVEAGFSAAEITNASGALISTTARGRNFVDLDLNSSGDFTNSGVISSSGSLDIKAGGNLRNDAGQISAVQNVSLHSKNVINSGQVVATNGNVTIDAPPVLVPMSDNPPGLTTTGGNTAIGITSQALTIDNSGGVVQALNGDINIRETSYDGTSDSSITGGDLLSQRLVLNSGRGTINVDVGQLTGTVVSSGSAVHVFASTDNLSIGTQCLAGDPTFYNNLGGIIISGDIIVAETLAIVAKGDITATSGLTQISASTAGAGFDINIIAGVDVAGPDNATATLPPLVSPSGFIVFTGASTTGGNLDLTGASSTLSISSAQATSTTAGNITLAAYGINSSTGHVLLPLASNISAAGSGVFGSVMVVSGSTGGNAISLGKITDGAGGSGANNVTIACATPSFSSGTSMSFAPDGSSTKFLTYSPNSPLGGTVNLGEIRTTGDLVALTAGTLNANDTIVSLGGVGLMSRGDINLNADISSKKGILVLSGTNVSTTAAGVDLNSGNLAGNAGAMTIIAGANFSFNGSDATITGGSASGGNIDFSTTPISSINARGVTGSGGDITIAAFAVGSTGSVSINPLITIRSDGDVGSNGNVTIIAGKTSGTSIFVGDIDTTGASASSGGKIFLTTSNPFAVVLNPVIVNAVGPTAGAIVAGSITNGPTETANIATGDLTAKSRNIIVAAGQNVVLGDLDASAITTTSQGGSVDIQAPGSSTLTIGTVSANSIASINVSGGGTSGDAGGISVSSNSNISFTVGSLVTNVTDGSGADVVIDAGLHTVVLPSATFSVDGAGNGNGGFLQITAIQISSFNPSTLTANGAGTGSGGGIVLEFTGNSGFAAVDSTSLILQARSGASGGNGGSIDVEATNKALFLDGSAIDVSVQGPNGNGGSIFIEAASFPDSGNPIHLTANGVGTGNGGVINVQQNGSAQLVVGNAGGQFQFTALGGPLSTTAGTLSVVTNGDLLVDASALNLSPVGANSVGASVLLQAGETGAGNLLINGNLNVNGSGTGTGGSLNLVSNSSLDFNIFSKKAVNGVNGTLSLLGATNGPLVVTNNAGGIITSGDLLGAGNITFNTAGTGGNITLGGVLGDNGTISVTFNANGTTGNITSKKEIVGGVVNLLSTNGFIGGKKALKLNTTSLLATAQGAVNLANSNANLSISGAQSGTSDLKITSTGSVDLTGSLTATNITIIGSGIINVNNGVSVNGDAGVGIVTLDAGKGAGTIQCDPASGSINGFNVVLKAGSGKVGTAATDVVINTSNLDVSADNSVFLANLGINPINLNSASTAGSFNLTSNGTINVNASPKSATDILLGGSTNAGVNLNTSVGSKTCDAIVLKANGTGDIVQATTKIKLTSNLFLTLDADAGTIGTSNIPIVTVSKDVSVLGNGTSSVNISSALKKNAVALSCNTGSGGGGLLFTAVGPTNLDNINAKSISVTITGGRLGVVDNVSLITTDGGILLNNNGKGKGSAIVLGASSTLKTVATAPGGGEVDIVMGTLPPPTNAGTNPGVTITGSGGTVFFNNGITVIGTNTINLKNTDVNFSSGSFGPASISLNGGVLIDADPLLPAPTAAIEMSTGFDVRSPHRSSPIESAFAQVTEITPNLNLPSLTVQEPISTTEHLSMINAFGNSTSNPSISLVGTQPVVVSSSQNQSAYGYGFKSGWISETEIETGEIPASFAINANQEKNVLNSGSILSASPDKSAIETPLGRVDLAANSVALVMSFSEGVAIYNLHDSNRNSVTFKTDNRTVSIPPGQSLVVTNRSNARFAEINPAQLIAHRSLRERQLGNGLKMIQTEFSVPSALNVVLPIRDLMKSKHPHALRTTKHLLKTASILMQLQAGGEDFRQHRKPQVTAYNH